MTEIASSSSDSRRVLVHGNAARRLTPPEPPIAPDSQLPGTIISIQILRFAAAFLVVLYHSHVALTSGDPGDVPSEVQRAFRIGASGVHIFFVISGFVMVYTSLRSRLTTKTFLQRRLIRIYPIYWLTAVIYLAVHDVIGTPYVLSDASIVKSLLLLPDYASEIIGPGWTLAFEMYFYLCFAALLFFGVFIGTTVLTLFYLFSVTAGLAVADKSTFLDFTTNSLLLEFIGGAWLGIFHSKGFQVTPRIGLAMIALAAALFAGGIWLPVESIPSAISWGVPSLLLLCGALGTEPWLNLRTARAFAKLGDSSYLLYLSHVLIIDILLCATAIWTKAIFKQPATVAFFIALIVTAIAAVGHQVLEKPLLRAVKRATMRRFSADTTNVQHRSGTS